LSSEARWRLTGITDRIRSGLRFLGRPWGAEQQGIAARVGLLEYRTGDLPTAFRGDYWEHSANVTMQQYWTQHNVTRHTRFTSAEESLAHFRHRNQLYPGYIEMMPVDDCHGKVVVDYGCGPGNDLVGFALHSKPSRLVGVDISAESLAQAKSRLALHEATAELVDVPYGTYELPLDSDSVDRVHCSGVLMLIEEPGRLLAEFARVLRLDGELRLMVYHYDSVWLHLYVAHVMQLEYGIYAGIDVREAFSRTTDGEDCPLVHVWKTTEVEEMASAAGFRTEFLGAAPSLWELHVLPRRFRAAMNERLDAEHRDFLMSLELDSRGRPFREGHLVGIDGCYRLTRRV